MTLFVARVMFLKCHIQQNKTYFMADRERKSNVFVGIALYWTLVAIYQIRNDPEGNTMLNYIIIKCCRFQCASQHPVTL